MAVSNETAIKFVTKYYKVFVIVMEIKIQILLTVAK